MNAKQELISLFSRAGHRVKCAIITRESIWLNSPPSRTFCLNLGYTETEMEVFLQELAFDYDNGYGKQELFGTVWFENATWADRGEYDGSEWWDLREVPSIPSELVK